MGKRGSHFLGLAAAALLAFSLGGCAVWHESWDDWDKEEEPESSAAPATPSATKLDDLIVKMREASDPQSRYQNCDSYIIKQRLEKAPGDTGPSQMVEVIYKKPGLFKTNTYSDNKLTGSIICKGGQAWSVNPSTGESRELKGVMLEQVKLLCEMGAPDKTLKDVFRSVEVLECVIGMKEYYKLVCAPRCSDLKNYSIYVGKNNNLTKMLYCRKYAGSDLMEYTSVLDKYALKDDVYVASETTVVTGGKTFKYVIVDYQINPAISDAEFDLPTAWFKKL